MSNRLNVPSYDWEPFIVWLKECCDEDWEDVPLRDLKESFALFMDMQFEAANKEYNERP